MSRLYAIFQYMPTLPDLAFGADFMGREYMHNYLIATELALAICGRDRLLVIH